MRCPDAFFEDQETGEQMLVNTSDPEFRERYAALVKAKRDAFFCKDEANRGGYNPDKYE